MSRAVSWVVSWFGLSEKRSTLGRPVQKSKVVKTAHGESEQAELKGVKTNK